MAFSDEFIEELLDRNDIVDVVSSYVRLTKKSSKLFGLCPFHSEKTPSFSVTPERQMYYCFGCHKGGGVINFIMEIENLPYKDAVEFLARRAGMEVTTDSNNTENQHKRDRILSLNKEAALYYNSMLYAPEGKKVLEYALKRKITKKTQTNFGLGAATDSWTGLVDAMLSKGYSRDELVSAGLATISKKNGGVYDFFRSRLIFPIIDVKGNVLGFSGRILEGSERKYVNTKDTLVYNKKKNLFALNLAKKSKRGYIILTEGNIDVVSLHQSGFDCTVATLGTALTDDQARLISKYTQNIVLAYDSDGAGSEATKKAITVLNRAGLNVKVLQIRGAKDPDEYITRYGKEAFEKIIDQSENQVEYRLLKIQSKYNLELDEDRVQFLIEACDLIARLPSPAERSIYGSKVAKLANVTPETVEAEAKRAYLKKQRTQKKQEEKQYMKPIAQIQPTDRAMRYSNPKSALAEEGIIRLLFLDTELFKKFSVDTSKFTSPMLTKIFNIAYSRLLEGKEVNVSVMSGELENSEMSELVRIISKPETLSEGTKALQDYLNIIEGEHLKNSSQDDLLAVAQQLKEQKAYGGKK